MQSLLNGLTIMFVVMTASVSSSYLCFSCNSSHARLLLMAAYKGFSPCLNGQFSDHISQ